jgi:hypothetical protein
MDLLKTARFGQTEVGSFVLTIECSIAPRLQGSLLAGADHDAPFERQTSLRLAQALQGAENASRESAASGKLDPFRARAHEGVTANLCESLADLIVAAEADRIRASFSFASRRPLTQHVPSTASFSADLAPILREAAKQLRYETPQPDVEIIGPVVKLTSSDLNVGGEAVVQTVIDGKARSVRARLRADAIRVRSKHIAMACSYAAAASWHATAALGCCARCGRLGWSRGLSRSRDGAERCVLDEWARYGGGIASHESGLETRLISPHCERPEKGVVRSQRTFVALALVPCA